jgi:hypothetical protein
MNCDEFILISSRVKINFFSITHFLNSRKRNNARNVKNHSSYRLSLSTNDFMLLKSDEEKGEEKLR